MTDGGRQLTQGTYMDLLTQRQTAELTRLSGRTLERHRLAGTGPKFVRLGRRILYRRDDIEAWIADCTCSSTSEAEARAAGREVAALRAVRPSPYRDSAHRTRRSTNPALPNLPSEDLASLTG